MDKLMNVVKLLWNHSNKFAYLIAILAVAELCVVFGMALLDGRIDPKERDDIKAASERVVESLP